jgi:cytoskeletal protein CcmA (bactofilin family)
MHRRVSAAALVALGLATITGCGFQHDDGDAVSRQFGADHFAVGGMLNLTDPVQGDAFLVGGQVSIASEIQGDLVVAGGELSIGGAVGDDLYAAGGDVALDAIVSGNARLAGGDVTVGPATVVAGALSLTGGKIRFEGNTHGYLQAAGASVRIDGAVHGDAEVKADELVIGPEARIRGRLIVTGPREPEVAEGAVIEGGIEFQERGSAVDSPDEAQPPVADSTSRLGSFLWFVGVFLAAALFLAAFPRFARNAASVVGRRPLQSLGLGLAIVAAVPLVAVVLLITIVGIPLALLLVPAYFLLLFLGWATAALFVGQRGLEALRPGRIDSRGAQLVALFLALVALWLVRQIPLVGGLIAFIALVLGIGALTWQAWNGRQAAA